jgi:tetratricopeptide (TPR) repeat protein
MRLILVTIGFLLLAAPVWAQSADESVAQCNSKDAGEEIKGCGALIDGRAYRGADLAGIYYNRASGYASLKQFDAAIADYTMAVSLKADFAAAYSNRGAAYADKASYGQVTPADARALNDQSMADYARAIALKPDFFEAYNNLANGYRVAGNLDAAISTYSKSIEIKPNPVGYWERAKIYDSKQMHVEAVNDLTNAIGLAPSFGELYSMRGYEYIQLGRYDLARPDLDTAVADNPNSAIAHYWRGILVVGRENQVRSPSDLDAALQDFDEAIRLQPNFEKALAGRGYARAIKLNLDGAISDLTEAIRLDPNDAETYWERATALSLRKEKQKAIEDLDQALRLKPDWPRALAMRGDVRADLHDFPAAIADFERAIAVGGDNPILLYQALGGRCAARTWTGANLDEALADCNRAIQLQPSIAIGYNARAYLRIRLRQYGEALSDCQQSIALSPTLADGYYLRGIVERHLGRAREAAADIARAIGIRAGVVDDYDLAPLTARR